MNPAPPMPPELAPFQTRWNTFADKIRARIKEVEAEANAAYKEVIAIDVLQGTGVNGVSNALKARLQGLDDKIDEAWSKLDRFRGDSSFGTWMHRVAVNTVLGRLRKTNRERDRIHAVSDAAPPVESIGDSGRLRDLENAMNELPSGARHVFVLHAVYGYSHEETSDMLGIASGTSKAQLHRARRLLAQQLDVSL